MRAVAVMGASGNISQVEYSVSNGEFLPTRFTIESNAMTGWVNCPGLAYDYNDHYNEIGVPLLAFDSGLFSNRTGTLRFVNGINSTDFTAIMLPTYGHCDVYMGTYSARDVSQPALDWMLNRARTDYRSLAATAFCNVTVLPGWTWYFFVHSNGGTGSHSYQWYEGSTLLVGQTGMVLPVSKGAAGKWTFYCKVTDGEGTTTISNTIALTVWAPF
jgi:hypothetical protein